MPSPKLASLRRCKPDQVRRVLLSPTGGCRGRPEREAECSGDELRSVRTIQTKHLALLEFMPTLDAAKREIRSHKARRSHSGFSAAHKPAFAYRTNARAKSVTPLNHCKYRVCSAPCKSLKISLICIGGR